MKIEKQLWSALFDMTQAFQTAYPAFGQVAFENETNAKWRALVPELLCRHVMHLARDAKIRLYRYEGWIPGKWAEVHALVSRATSMGIERQPVMTDRESDHALDERRQAQRNRLVGDAVALGVFHRAGHRLPALDVALDAALDVARVKHRAATVGLAVGVGEDRAGERELHHQFRGDGRIGLRRTVGRCDHGCAGAQREYRAGAEAKEKWRRFHGPECAGSHMADGRGSRLIFVPVGVLHLLHRRLWCRRRSRGLHRCSQAVASKMH